MPRRNSETASGYEEITDADIVEQRDFGVGGEGGGEGPALHLSGASGTGERWSGACLPDRQEAREKGERVQKWVELLVSGAITAFDLEQSDLDETEMAAVGRELAMRDLMTFWRGSDVFVSRFSNEDKKLVIASLLEVRPDLASWITAILRCPTSLAAEAIRGISAESREKALKKMKVPSNFVELDVEQIREFELEWKTRIESGREKDRRIVELYEMAAESRLVSEEMREALTDAFPELTDGEREMAETERQLLEAPFERISFIGSGMNGAVAVFFEGRDLPAVYKTGRQEWGYDEEEGPLLRSGIEPGTAVRREWLAYMLSRVADPGLVPVTVLRSGPSAPGSFQAWELGTPLDSTKFVGVADDDPKFRKELRRNACFDTSVCNSDRHPGNKQIGNDEKLKDIDNGFTFPHHNNQYDELRSCAMWVVAGERIDDDILAGYERVLASVEAAEKVASADAGFDLEPVTDGERKLARVADVSRRAFELTLGKVDGERAWQEFLGNVRNLVGTRKLGSYDNAWADYEVGVKNYPEKYR